MTDSGIRVVIADSIVSFFAGVPVVYALVLLAQLPLLAFGHVPFSAHAYFVRPAAGALVGTGLGVLWNLKGTFSIASEPGSGDGAALHRLFLAGVELQVPVAFLIAALFAAPGHNSAALIVIGALRGIVAAAVPAAFTVLVYHKAVRTGWPVIVIIEIVIALGGLAGGLSGQLRAQQTLELVVPAAIACAVTYGLADLIATLLRAARTPPDVRPALAAPAAGPGRPARQRSADPGQGPGRDRNRGRPLGQGRRTRRSKRRPRRRR